MDLLLATQNRHKLREVQLLLQDIPHLRLLCLADLPEYVPPEENGQTMAENARLKALAAAAASGHPTLGEDSGLEVDALDGAPGLHSARWVAGTDEDRTQALLKKLKKVPVDERRARYRCALCLAMPGVNGTGAREVYATQDVCEGAIAGAPAGKNGFGYDPVFLITEESGAPATWIGRTMAEAPPEIKARISHRGRALSQLRLFLQRS